MKYLQIYDHNGNLTKEFPVYVDGADFTWAADKPEAVWFGTIRLVSEPSEILVTPTPEPELESKEAMAINIYGQEIPLAEAIEAERQAAKVEEAEVESQTPFMTQEPTTETQPDVFEKIEEVKEQVEKVEQLIELESEVKDEPTKRVHKGGRKSRAKPSDGAEGSEAVS